MVDKFNIVKEIVLNTFVVLVIYNETDSTTNDAIIVKNKPQSQSLDEFNNRPLKQFQGFLHEEKAKKEQK